MSVKVSLGGQLKLNADVINCDLCQNATKKNPKTQKDTRLGGVCCQRFGVCFSEELQVVYKLEAVRASVPPHVLDIYVMVSAS